MRRREKDGGIKRRDPNEETDEDEGSEEQTAMDRTHTEDE